jgi:hypothetical protein
MKVNPKTFAALAGPAILLSAVSSVNADIIDGNLQEWIDTPVQAVTRADSPNLIFTYLGSGAQNPATCTYIGCELNTTGSALPTTTVLNIGVNSDDRYAVNFSRGLGIAAGVYTIQYYVDVDGWFGQDFRLTEVFTGIERVGDGGSSVTKDIKGVLPLQADADQDPTGPAGGLKSDDTSWTVLGPDAGGWDGVTAFDAFDASTTSTGGSVTAPFCGQCARFLITDTITVIGGDTVTSVSNTFDQGVVPAPATLLLLGAGVLGLGFVGRLRKNSK